MRKNKISDALGTVDPAFLQEAAEFTAQPTSLFGKQTFRVLGICAALVLAVCIALAVAPRLPAILPPNTDTSHIQGTANTTDQTDSSDTQTDSSTDTGVTDTGTNQTTNQTTPKTPTLPFADTEFIGKTDGTYQIPQNKSDVVFLEAGGGSDSAGPSIGVDGVLIGSDLTASIAEGVLNVRKLNLKNTTVTDATAPVGRETIILPLNGINIVLTYKETQQTHFATSSYDLLQKTALVDEYKGDGKMTVATVSRTTGRLIDYYRGQLTEEKQGDSIPMERLREIADKTVRTFYGEEALNRFTFKHIVTSGTTPERIYYIFDYILKIGAYETEERIRIGILDNGYVYAITTMGLGYFDDAENLPTEAQIDAAADTARKAFETISSLEVHRRDDGSFLLYFIAKGGRQCWIPIG